MPDEALKQAKHGPLTVLLLLCGLVFGSAFAPGAGIDPEGPRSRLSQSRPAKGFVALRTPARDLAAEADDERADGPGLPSGATIVTAASVRPGLPFAAAAAADRPRLQSHDYRARAPPAA